MSHGDKQIVLIGVKAGIKNAVGRETCVSAEHLLIPEDKYKVKVAGAFLVRRHESRRQTGFSCLSP